MLIEDQENFPAIVAQSVQIAWTPSLMSEGARAIFVEMPE
jgi:hypothetical protein